MKYIKSFNESLSYEDYVTDDIMDSLSDCLLEVFDHFSIPMTSDGKFTSDIILGSGDAMVEL